MKTIGGYDPSPLYGRIAQLEAELAECKAECKRLEESERTQREHKQRYYEELAECRAKLEGR